MSATSNSSARSASSKLSPIRPISRSSITPAMVSKSAESITSFRSMRGWPATATPRTRRYRWSGWLPSADGAKRLRLIVLDACRDNPFVKIHAPGTQDRQPGGQRGSRQGRADQHRHADRLRREGRLDGRRWRRPAQPFTTAVLKNLTVPGLDVRLAFGRVRDEVLRSTGEPAGALCLWLARRRQYCARAGTDGGAGGAGQRHQGRL